ncbi:MAG: Hsp20/alpha crystallin family protein [Gammaproteobacteria bacterium]|nr:Hsp20/alpha crystallin family protein [Gammaproteobacteria bacterium]
MTRKYEPFINLAGLERWQQELGKIFDIEDFIKDDISSGATSHWKPRADIRDSKEHYVIEMDLPGVDPAAIDVALKAGVLTVSGQRSGAESDTGEYKLMERRTGEFHRRFTLPELADEEQVQATSDNGVLTVTIKKKSGDNARHIRVVST